MKKLIFMACLMMTFGLQAQELKLTKGNRTKIIDVGTSIDVKYVHKDCLDCKFSRLVGEIQQVSQDSISFKIKRQTHYLSDGDVRISKSFDMEDKEVFVSIAKKDLRIIRKERNRKLRQFTATAGIIAGITSLSTLINIQVVEDKVSKGKLINWGLIQAGISAAGLVFTSVDPKMKIGKGSDLWKIN